MAGYRVDGTLGEGGMGTVYRATQLSLNRVVALKLLAQELSDDQGFRTRFEREGQLQAALDHRHIVPVYEAGQTEHGLFLAMRLINGPTLKQLIQNGQLDTRRTLRILAQVANALDEAHSAGLIHRDIKPQNILIDKDDHAYLCDFGLIKSPDDAESLTGTGQFLGTIDYVSPEQIQGEPATAASDCYSLTAVLYECLTGQVPFLRTTEAATVHAHIVDPPPKPTELQPGLPVAIDGVIAAGMAKDPAARPGSASALIRAASAGLAGASPSAQPTRLTATGDDGGAQGTRLAGIAPAEVTRASAAATPSAAPTALSAAPTAPPVAAGPAEPASQRRAGGAWPVALALALAVAAVAAGVLVGHSSKKQRVETPLASSAAAGHLRLRYPSAWQLSTNPPTLPGTSFSSPIVLSSAAGTVDAGEVTNGGGPSLLSPGLRDVGTGGPPTGQPVKLGTTAALRYGPLHLRGTTGTVTVYAAPTSAGVATVACTAGTGTSGDFATACGRVAATLQLIGATAYPLGPMPAYARGLAATLTALRSSVAGPLGALRSAGTPGPQAAAARRLGAAYTSAAASVSRLAASPRDQPAGGAVSAALRQLASGYGRVATSAAAGNASAYRQAAREVASASTALHRAIAALSALGYRVGSS